MGYPCVCICCRPKPKKITWFLPGFGLYLHNPCVNGRELVKTSSCVLSAEIFWAFDWMYLCNVFVVAQKQEYFTCFQPAFGLQLHDHVVNGPDEVKTFLGVLGIEILWAFQWMLMCNLFVIALNHDNHCPF